MFKRLVLILGFIAVVAAISGGVWRYGYVQALGQVAQRGEADLALASDRLISQLKRYQEVAVLLADHPLLGDRAQGQGDADAADQLLLKAADKTSALAMFFALPDGQVIARSHSDGPQSLRGTPYFERAMQGALGNHHDVYDTSGRRAFYYAAPSFGPDGKVQGVVVAVADVEYVEWDWRGGRPTVFFVDDAGLVFISNRSELVFWQRTPGTADIRPVIGSAPAFERRDVGGHDVWLLDWGPYVPKRSVHLQTALPVIGMMGEALIDVSPALRLASLQAGVVGAVLLTFGALLFLATERRRTLARANAVLEARVAERTAELSTTNEQLLREVHERQEAEAALRRAQADLVQAGKLSALGQMSAGISHELNQPLTAIEQFATNARAFLDRGKPDVAGDNLNRIAELAQRMARIIKNLRAFARNESEPVGRVDIVKVIGTALELAQARLNNEGVVVDWTPPDHPIWVAGGEVRLGQVAVNLISNAVDAMADTEDKRLTLAVEDGARVKMIVTDTGPGIEDADKLFEPFYTTKQVGASEGMGLGLSISYGLIQSFGGKIRGENGPDGAIFTVELERWQDKAEAA